LYVDTSADAKLMVAEAESHALARHLDDSPDDAIASILDALHLATAVRLDVAAVVTYDIRMAEGARTAGLSVVAPS